MHTSGRWVRLTSEHVCPRRCARLAESISSIIMLRLPDTLPTPMV